MQSQSRDRPVGVVEGTLEVVDTISREVTVQVGDSNMTFDVLPDCAILLNRERVKLRLLQPTDRVCVTYCEEHGRHRARVIEV